MYDPWLIDLTKLGSFILPLVEAHIMETLTFFVTFLYFYHLFPLASILRNFYYCLK